MKSAKIICFFSAYVVQTGALFSTPLDDYVQRPDPHYQWVIERVEEKPEATTFVATLTSQQWRSPEEVNLPIWQHQLTVIAPRKILSNTALLFISEGLTDNATLPISFPNPQLSELALKNSTIVCELTMVPNQYLKFSDEWDARYLEQGRKEDALVAYTWDKYLKTEDASWPLRLPMTKSVVKSMDAVEELLYQKLTLSVEGFILVGRSKRGWTAWTSAAVDKRVKGVIPIVIDMFNLKVSFTRHFMAYGNWSFAVRDYADIHIPDRWDSEAFSHLMKIIEPFEYRERLTMPKYIICATGDEFFLPDSSQLYFKALPGEKHLLYLPNTGHKAPYESYAESLSAYISFLLSGRPLPSYSWELTQNQHLKVYTPDNPVSATLWQAHNPISRDFRMVTIGSNWNATALEVQQSGNYSISLPLPDNGWSAYFVELAFPSPNGGLFKVTTDVFILPNTFLFKYPS